MSIKNETISEFEHVADEQAALSHVFTKATPQVRQQYSQIMTRLRKKAEAQAGRRVLPQYRLLRACTEPYLFRLIVTFDLNPKIVELIGLAVNSEGVTHEIASRPMEVSQ